MISKTVFCILFHDTPIDGISTSTGISIPLMTFGTKLYPNLTFDTRESAESYLNNTLEQTLISNMPNISDVQHLKVGMIKAEVLDWYAPLSGYDLVLNNFLGNSELSAESYIPKIIQLCVIEGFKKVLPMKHQEIFDNPVFRPFYDTHVPFYVQENIDRFMDEGISACTPEEIGAIILTSTDEQLKAIRIDSFNNASK